MELSENKTAVKRKRVVLSLKDKLDILERLKAGDTAKSLATKYGIGCSTIFDIRKNSDNITKYVSVLDSEDGSTRRKSMKKAKNYKVEDAVYAWFIERRAAGHSTSGRILCQKALEFNELLNGDPEFKATSGWLQRFKNRHAIRDFEIRPEPALPETDPETDFLYKLEKIVERKTSDDFIYNAKQMCLNWKSLPDALTPDSAKSYSSESLIVMACLNASGSHKLPLLAVGQYKTPSVLQRMKNPPVLYYKQPHLLIGKNVFLEWYEKCFIPEVKKHQISCGKIGSTLLLLDNSPAYPAAEFLERDDGMFKALFFPPHVSDYMEPMKQGVIQTLKCYYKEQQLLRYLRFAPGNFFKDFDIKECFYMLVDAWMTVSPSLIHKAWSKTLNKSSDDIAEEIIEGNLEELVSAAKNIPELSDCQREDIERWFNVDCAIVKHEVFESESNELAIDVERITTDESDDDDDNEIPSHREAIKSLNVALKWSEGQSEFNVDQMLCLKRLRDLAACKKEKVKY